MFICLWCQLVYKRFSFETLCCRLWDALILSFQFKRKMQISGRVVSLVRLSQSRFWPQLDQLELFLSSLIDSFVSPKSNAAAKNWISHSELWVRSYNKCFLRFVSSFISSNLWRVYLVNDYEIESQHCVGLRRTTRRILVRTNIKRDKSSKKTNAEHKTMKQSWLGSMNRMDKR